MKERIQKLIDVYCAYMFSVDRDAGWHAPSQLDITQYKSNSGSDLLRITKFEARYCAADLHQVNDKPDDKMISEMGFVRKQHYEFKLAKMLLSKLEDKQLLALLAGRYLTHVNKSEPSNRKIADYLEIEVRSYRHNKTRAEILLEQHLSLIDQHEQLKTG